MYVSRRTFTTLKNKRAFIEIGLYEVRFMFRRTPISSSTRRNQPLQLVADKITEALDGLARMDMVAEGVLGLFCDPESDEHIPLVWEDALDIELRRSGRSVRFKVSANSAYRLWALSKAQEMIDEGRHGDLDEMCISLLNRGCYALCAEVDKCRKSLKGEPLDPMEYERFLVEHHQFGAPTLHIRWCGLWIKLFKASGFYKPVNRPDNDMVLWRVETAEARWRTLSKTLKGWVIKELQFYI